MLWEYDILFKSSSLKYDLLQEIDGVFLTFMVFTRTTSTIPSILVPYQFVYSFIDTPLLRCTEHQSGQYQLLVMQSVARCSGMSWLSPLPKRWNNHVPGWPERVGHTYVHKMTYNFPLGNVTRTDMEKHWVRIQFSSKHWSYKLDLSFLIKGCSIARF